jgi:hypothetical protein
MGRVIFSDGTPMDIEWPIGSVTYGDTYVLIRDKSDPNHYLQISNELIDHVEDKDD